MKNNAISSLILLGCILFGAIREQTAPSTFVSSGFSAKQQLNEKLLAAVQQGKREDIQVLLSLGADCGYVDFQNWSLLMHAIVKGDISIVKLLVECGANVNHANKNGFSVALAACGHDRYEILKYLITVGAKLSINENECPHCLSYAASGSDIRILKLLVEAGANINGRDCSGATPLMLASRFTTQAILDLGADVDLVDYADNTPTMLSIIQGEEVKFKILLKSKPNLQIVNKHGETAFDLAVKHDRGRMLTALKKLEAER